VSPNPTNTYPCPACTKPVPMDASACPTCRMPFKHGSINEIDSTPGAPYARRTTRKSRLSDRGYVPAALRDEIEAKRRAEADAVDANAGMAIRLVFIGASLAALPYGIGSVLFLPELFYASIAFVADALLGAVAGLLLARLGGSALKSLFLFGLAFTAGAFVKFRLGYPMPRIQVYDFENAGAIALLGATFLLTMIVAGMVGSAVDTHPLE
jgi:hypothetical protein